MIAAVFGVMAASTAEGSMSAVGGSTSASTGVAPAETTASAVAKNVLGGRMTSSPGPMPAACSMSSKAAVPEPTPTAVVAPTYVASAASNAAPSGPALNTF